MATVLLSPQEICKNCHKQLPLDPKLRPVVTYSLNKGTYLGCRLTKSAFHLSELTGLEELVLPGPNGKAVANLRDYARDMTCLRGQLRVFRNVNEQTCGYAVFPDCLRVFLVR